MPRFFSSALEKVDTAIVKSINSAQPQSRVFNYGSHVFSFATSTAIYLFAATTQPHAHPGRPVLAPRKRS